MSVPVELVEQIKRIVTDAGAVFEGIQETLEGRFPEVVFYDGHTDANKVLMAPFNPEKFSSRHLTDMIRRELEFNSAPHPKEKKKVTKTASTGLLSGTPEKLAVKLHRIYTLIPFIGKLGENSTQHYAYTRAADVVIAVRKALIEQGVYVEINHDFVGAPYTIARARDKEAPFSAVNVRCSLVFHDLVTGETMTASGIGTGADTGDKAGYKAMTGALKYALKNAFLIPDEEDPEADSTVDQPEPDPNAQEFERRAPRMAPEPRQAAPEPPAADLAAAFGKPVASAPEPAPAPATPAPEPGSDVELDKLPTEEQLAGYREEFKKLGDDLSAQGGLKASKGLPLNKKLIAFLLLTQNATDAAKLTVGQWENFFGRALQAITNPAVGLTGLAVLVNKANGIEEKK